MEAVSQTRLVVASETTHSREEQAMTSYLETEAVTPCLVVRAMMNSMVVKQRVMYAMAIWAQIQRRLIVK